jgi:hypothetical protein
MKNFIFSTHWVILFLFLYWLGSYVVHFEHQGAYINSDQEGYTMYLPALLLRGGFENMPTNTPYEYHPYPGTNKVFTRFTYGVALVESPFYLLSMFSRWIQDYPLNVPFARDYSIAILLAACFYTTLGVYVLSKVLFSFLQNIEKKERQNKCIAGISALLMLLGTNLLYYTTRQPGMSHHYTFCLLSILLYLLPQLYFNTQLSSKKSTLIYVFVCVLTALIILIRPTNGIVLLLVVAWNIGNSEDLKQRLLYFKTHWLKLLFVPIIFFLVTLPQMYYWHYVTGQWIYYSYEEQAFNWKNPQLYNIFFHLCNGVFPYAPLLFFPFLGIFIGVYNKILDMKLILVVFVLLSYVCASWWCWWFGGTYGYRSFSDFYPILAFPLAYYIHWVLKTRFLVFKILNFSLMFLFSFYCFRMVTACYNFQVEADGVRSELFLPAVKRCFWIE